MSLEVEISSMLRDKFNVEDPSDQNRPIEEFELDSLDFANFVFAIEQEFDVRFSGSEEASIADCSIASLATMIKSKRS